MTNPEEIKPDFATVTETLYEGGPNLGDTPGVQILEIVRSLPTSYIKIELIKGEEEAAGYIFEWATRQTALTALSKMVGTALRPDVAAKDGELYVYMDTNGEHTAPWKAEEPTDPAVLRTARRITPSQKGLVRLSTDTVMFRWQNLHGKLPTNGVSTAEPLNSTWLKHYFETTATTVNRSVFGRSVIPLTGITQDFMELPYGIPTTSAGFSPERPQ